MNKISIQIWKIETILKLCRNFEVNSLNLVLPFSSIAVVKFDFGAQLFAWGNAAKLKGEKFCELRKAKSEEQGDMQNARMSTISPFF